MKDHDMSDEAEKQEIPPVEYVQEKTDILKKMYAKQQKVLRKLSLLACESGYDEANISLKKALANSLQSEAEAMQAGIDVRDQLSVKFGK